MLKTITSFFGANKLKDRSKLVAKNALISLILKGATILTSFIFVPLYLNSVGQRQFGIILTITSISNFISFFDVGIGNGLRVKLGKAIADGDQKLGRQYVSTSYFYVTILFTTVFLVYCLASPFIQWHKILNIPANEIHNLNVLMLFVIGLYTALFVFNLLTAVMMAAQKSFMKDLITFSSSLVIIVCCLILKGLHLLDFYKLLIIMCSVPVLSQIIYSFIFYNSQYSWLRPSLSFINHSLRKDLLGLGAKFFLIQIVALLIFSTTNILIAQLFNVSEVTRYNIAFKYYNITVIVFNILMSPLWGAFTQAWHQNDKKWITKNIKFYLLIVIGFVAINILQFFVYPYFIKLWLKREFVIPLIFAISLMLYNFILCYNDIFAHFLASIGNINKQVYAAVAGGLVNIPITIYLANHTSLGLAAILFANIICLLPSTIVTTIQTYSLLRSK
jgi:O-antigen/teichoic acid export membrane protein